jgi:hypothetical protein
VALYSKNTRALKFVNLFSKVLYKSLLYSKHIRALTFENLYRSHGFGWCGIGTCGVLFWFRSHGLWVVWGWYIKFFLSRSHGWVVVWDWYLDFF